MNNNQNLIVITLDEAIIQHLISNKTGNTQILMPKHKSNNIVQVNKRILESNIDNDQKSVKVAKKWIGAICIICGDQSIGYNYNVLTCASCRSFFRRNLNENMEKLRCLSGREQCLVSHEIQRKCQKCRLKRCLAMGMKSKPVEENLLMNENNKDNVIDSKVITDTLFSRLSVEDWITIQNIQSSFKFFFQIPVEENSALMDFSDRNSALISLSYVASQNATLFIDFFRHINEFQQLNADDRFILTKYNLFSIFLSSKGYYYKETTCLYSSKTWQKEDEHNRRLLSFCDCSPFDLNKFEDLTECLIELTERDPTILSLLSIILMFSPGISMDEDEPSLKDPLTINRIQSYFTQILWNFLVDKFDEIEAYKYFIRLFILILKIQLGTKQMRQFFQHQYIITNTKDKIAPLMQTILLFS